MCRETCGGENKFGIRSPLNSCLELEIVKALWPQQTVHKQQNWRENLTKEEFKSCTSSKIGRRADKRGIQF